MQNQMKPFWGTHDFCSVEQFWGTNWSGDHDTSLIQACTKLTSNDTLWWICRVCSHSTHVHKISRMATHTATVIEGLVGYEFGEQERIEEGPDLATPQHTIHNWTLWTLCSNCYDWCVSSVLVLGGIHTRTEQSLDTLASSCPSLGDILVAYHTATGCHSSAWEMARDD